MDEKLIKEIGKAIAAAIRSEVMPVIGTQLAQAKADLSAHMATLVAGVACQLQPQHGKDGKDGKDGLDGVNGLDGAEGVPGRDGLTLEQVRMWVAGAHAKDSVVTHRGGVFKACADTELEPGMANEDWLCLVNGIADARIAPTANADAFQLVTELSDGQKTLCAFAVPVLTPKGLWEADKVYAYLDFVQKDGCTWLCLANNTVGATEEPGHSPNWQLMAKKGDRGKAAKAEGEA